MASQSELQNFQQSWSSTANWAQGQGIKYNDYYPVYQQDSQRLLAGESPMSQAERERAITAAANVGKPTQLTPSTAANPGNVIGNTITDARNIFTGLGDIAAHPLHNGLVDSVKNTFDDILGGRKQAAPYKGADTGAVVGNALTSTVLSWIPGAADVGNVLMAEYGPGHTAGWKGTAGDPGLALLATHPLQSILDLAPLGRFGSLVKDLPATEDAAGRTALQRTGAKSQEELNKMGPIRLAKGLVMNKPTGVVGPKGLMTIGDRFHLWTGGTILNLNPEIADAMGYGTSLLTHANNEKRAMTLELSRTTEDLTAPQVLEMHDVVQKSQYLPGGLNEAMEGVTDPRVLDALHAWAEQNDWSIENGLSQEDGPVLIRDPVTGKQGVYSLGGHIEVIHARDAAIPAEHALLEAMPSTQKLVEQSELAGQFVTKSTDALEQANSAARDIRLEGNLPLQLDTTELGPIRKKIPGYKTASAIAHHPTPFARDTIAKGLFDTGGWVPRLIEKVRAGEFETAEKNAADVLNRLDRWGVDRVDTADLDPAFQHVRTQVEQLHKALQALNKANQLGSKAAHGAAEKWNKETPYRDARHEQVAKALDRKQVIERNHKAAEQRQTLAHLHSAYVAKRAEITQRFARARSDRTNTLRDGTRNINERYRLAKRELRNRHLQARVEWETGPRELGYPETVRAAPRIAPGAVGSRKAIEAGVATLEAARKQEIADLLASLPTREELNAKQQAEMSASRLAENEMSTEVKKAQAKDTRDLETKQAEARRQLEVENLGKKAREGKLSQLVDDYVRTQDNFSTAIYRNPSDNLQPIWTRLLARNLVEDERAKESILYKSKVLAEKFKWTDQYIHDLHTNKQVLANLIEMGFKDDLDDPIYADLDAGLVEHAKNSAYEALAGMEAEGLGTPQWVHHVSATQIKNDEEGSAGIRLLVERNKPKPNVLNPRVWGLGDSKLDLSMAIDGPQRDFLERQTWKRMAEYLDGRVVTDRDLLNTILMHFPEEASSLTLDSENLLTFATEKMGGFNLEQFDPDGRFGTRLARWGMGRVYLDKDLLRALEKLSNGGVMKGGIITKGTKLFRYSILGLSPRYDAHIVFGGTFLLGLRDPMAFFFVPQMLKDMKEGNLPEDNFIAPTNMGTPDWQLQSKKQAMDAFHTHGGKYDTPHLLGQEWHAVRGLNWREHNPLTWIKAFADINLHFTRTVTEMQRGLAQLSGEYRARGKSYFIDDDGNKVPMTREREIYEGTKNVARVYGDLRRMSPFERDVARTIMPFYGWQKHILQYVFTYPADHPWRALMLANMAEYDSSHTPGGLPSRYQFLYFLGTPDAQGNVTAIDTRAVNPLRDVANYATWGGFISSINPVITASVAAIDPQIIYGGNTLYPDLTYDQFYGIEEAGPQGNLLTAASQIVPQISGIQSAMQLAGQRQGMSDSELIKSIGNQLNFPWVPQTINLKQEAAKQAIDQYQVTKQLASNAWTSGNFQSISDLGSVPDPRNADYETPVSELEQLYSQLSKEYPGVPPSETAPPLPSLTL